MVGSCYIDVTGASVVDRSQFEAAIARLVVSHSLHGSESLCKLLRYLAKQAIDHPGAQVKEYQIATEVLGRQKDFDPQLDSMVRVQAGRLRAKADGILQHRRSVGSVRGGTAKGQLHRGVSRAQQTSAVKRKCGRGQWNCVESTGIGRKSVAGAAIKCGAAGGTCGDWLAAVGT